MSKKNPVGSIPIATPMLHRIVSAAMGVYLGMTEKEVKALDQEIKSVSDINCNSDIYDMAKMLEDRVGKNQILAEVHDVRIYKWHDR